jgi:hypothetical protein
MTSKPWTASLQSQTMHCSTISPLSALECSHAPALHDCGASANNSMPAVPSVAFRSANAHAQLSICRRQISQDRSFAIRLTRYTESWMDTLRSEYPSRKLQSNHYRQPLSLHSSGSKRPIVSVNAASPPHAGSCDKQRLSHRHVRQGKELFACLRRPLSIFLRVPLS